VCKCVLPPGDNPIAVNKYIISYNIYLLNFKRHATLYIETLWKCMEEIKIPKKLINMCKTCVRKTRSDVTREGTLSSFFENKT